MSVGESVNLSVPLPYHIANLFVRESVILIAGVESSVKTDCQSQSKYGE